MDLLQLCAQEFYHLLSYQYHIIIGRKGKIMEFTISFDQADFHHLAGLHKLRDNLRLQTGKRSDVMKEILEIIFRYNARANIFSVIQADYLLQNDYGETPVYLFLSQRSDGDTQVCRTLFPKMEKDYAQGQPRYTLLKKEKMNLNTGEIILQYDRLTSKAVIGAPVGSEQ